MWGLRLTADQVQALRRVAEAAARREQQHLPTAAPTQTLPSLSAQRAAAASALGDAFPSCVIVPRHGGIVDGVAYEFGRPGGVVRDEPEWRVVGRAWR